LWYAKKYGNLDLLKFLRLHSIRYKLKRFFIWVSVLVVITGGSWAFLQYPNTLKNKIYEYTIDHGYFPLADFLSNQGTLIVVDNNISKLVFNELSANRLKYMIRKNELNLNSQNSDGKTILHYAYEKGTKDIISFLLKHGADENIKDKYGRRPCFYAVYNPHKDVESCATTLKKDNK
jgi:ankyrin repeat protein